MLSLNRSALIYAWLQSLGIFDYKKTQILHDYFIDCSGYREQLESEKEFFIKEIGEEKYGVLIKSANSEYLKGITEGLEKNGVDVIDQDSEYYPSQLFGMENPPHVLYVKGNKELLNTRLFTVVGSRKSLAYSISTAKDLVKELSKEFTVVTGLAQGVEKAIVETLAQLNEKAICVLPSGIENVYPSAHKNILELFCKNGLVVSEYYLTESCRPYYFPRRNQILAMLGEGTLVVNGDEKSGCMQTAESAKEFNKQVFALPYSIGIQSGEGCNRLIKNGAHLVTCVDDVFECYKIEKREEKRAELSKEEKAVTTVLEEPKHIEQIAKELGKEVFEISPIISMLEIKGVILKSGVNVYRLAK